MHAVPQGGRGGPLWRRVSFRLDAPGSAPAADGTTGTASVLRAGGVAATHRTGACKHGSAAALS
jgi:hypothetical protein